MNIRIALCAMLWLGAALAPATVHAQAASDNPSVTPQLDAVKPLVAKIKKDATTMQSFGLVTGPSWTTHAGVLARMKDDVNKLQESTRGLQSHRTVASAWQQDAIDRISALANDLANNMNAAIGQLNKSKARPTASPYPEYLKENTRLVTALGDEINAVIDAGEAKVKQDALSKKLD